MKLAKLDNVHRIQYDAAPETPDTPRQMFLSDDAPTGNECIPAHHQFAIGSL